MEIQNITGVVVTGVTLLDSAFWTFHPTYCKYVHIHHITIQIPWGGFNGELRWCCVCLPNGQHSLWALLVLVVSQKRFAILACCAVVRQHPLAIDRRDPPHVATLLAGDGIDVDSCQNVLIEHNYINCGDDHVTILSGVGKAGQDFNMPSKNITVVDNKLGTGMGISIGSSVSGGVEDVLYARNVMNETEGQWGMGVHIKTRTTYGGYIRNIVYEDNVFHTAGVPGGALHIECGYVCAPCCALLFCSVLTLQPRNLVFTVQLA